MVSLGLQIRQNALFQAGSRLGHRVFCQRRVEFAVERVEFRYLPIPLPISCHFTSSLCVVRAFLSRFVVRETLLTELLPHSFRASRRLLGATFLRSSTGSTAGAASRAE